MKDWQQTYDIEQTELATRDDRVITTRHLRPCNAMAPVDGVTFCLKPFSGTNSFCFQVKGHPGAHSKQVGACNRPVGHEGEHAFLALDCSHGYQQLAAWT